jgi:hypothetical protein
MAAIFVRTFPFLFAVLLTVSQVMSGCANPAAPSASEEHRWTDVDAENLSPQQAGQRDVALAAREAMFTALFAELSAAMAEGGPGAAIPVCADRAPQIAAETSAAYGVRIGRTSWKLRNPANAPPAWAEDAIAGRPTEPAYFASDTGRLGALSPITVAAACLKCHGSPEQLAPGVGDQLAALYPEDRATGFREGDLRGWFWVEVPPADGDA